MHRLLYISTIWLLLVAAFCSCSKFDAQIAEGASITISGNVSDISSGKALEDVRIQFLAYDSRNMKGLPVTEQKVYTDSKGTYTISASGFASPVTCVIIAEGEGYGSVRKEVFINWEGSSYDRESNTFYVNECNFHMERNE